MKSIKSISSAKGALLEIEISQKLTFLLKVSRIDYFRLNGSDKLEVFS